MASSDRLYVTLEEKKLLVQGILHDSSTFEMFHEHINNINSLDLSGLLNASWIGLVNFLSYIESKRTDQIDLERVPQKIYSDTRFLLKRFEKINAISFFVPTLGAGDTQTENILAVNSCTIENIAEPFFNLSKDSKNLAIGFGCDFIPSKHHRSELKILIDNTPPASMQAHHFFIYNFFAYSLATIDQSSRLVFSSCQAIARLIRLVKLRVENSENALQILKPDYQPSLYLELNHLLESIEKEQENLIEGLSNTQKKLESSHLDFLKCLNKEGDTNQEKISIAEKFLSDMQEISNFVSHSENLGTEIGSKILGLKVIGRIKNVFNRVPKDLITEESLEEVRDALEIMDVLSEDDWDLTLEEINHISDSVDKDIGQCVVLLQGFDLIRQLLEHRQKEQQLVQGEIGNILNSEKYLEGIASSMNMIKKHIVTDQERAAYEFFLEIYQTKNQEADISPPGDIILF